MRLFWDGRSSFRLMYTAAFLQWHIAARCVAWSSEIYVSFFSYVLISLRLREHSQSRPYNRTSICFMSACAQQCSRRCGNSHLLLDRSPNIGPLVSRWELDKFKNCWYKRYRTFKILTFLYQKFLNLLISQRDMSGPRLGALSNYRWLGIFCYSVSARPAMHLLGFGCRTGPTYRMSMQLRLLGLQLSCHEAILWIFDSYAIIDLCISLLFCIQLFWQRWRRKRSRSWQTSASWQSTTWWPSTTRWRSICSTWTRSTACVPGSTKKVGLDSSRANLPDQTGNDHGYSWEIKNNNNNFPSACIAGFISFPPAPVTIMNPISLLTYAVLVSTVGCN